MELLEGETLNKYLERPDATDVESKIDLMIQICQGLHAAHSHGIFHRDVKPGNLLVRSNGELKIVDFGIARLASSSMTASGLVVGTPDYMSPEQARGHEIDQRSDIFSAGAVFYFMLTGRKPFAASGLTEVLAKVQSERSAAAARGRGTRPARAAGHEGAREEPRRPLRDMWTDGCAAGASEARSRNRSGTTRSTRLTHRLRALEALANPATHADHRAGHRSRARRSRDEPPRSAREAQLAGRTVPAERRDDLLAELSSVQKRGGRRRRQVATRAEGSRGGLACGRGRADARRDRALRAGAHHRTGSHACVCRSRPLPPDACRAASDRRPRRGPAGGSSRAAAAKQWQAVLDLCSDALELDSHTEDAAALKRKALGAIDAEARERRIECERALARGEAHLRKKRFQEASIEVAKARGLDPDAPELRVFEDRLTSSIAESEREAQLKHDVAEATAAARQAFASGARDRALADLRSFHARAPDPMVAAEITRLEAEAQRITAAEQRAAEAAAHAAAAEAALAAGNPQQALDRARRALAVDPRHPLARKVSGLAGAEVKQQAEARARAATAARHIEEAEQQLARGKFQKARALVSEAANLNPADSQPQARARAHPGSRGASGGRGGT